MSTIIYLAICIASLYVVGGFLLGIFNLLEYVIDGIRDRRDEAKWRRHGKA